MTYKNNYTHKIQQIQPTHKLTQSQNPFITTTKIITTPTQPTQTTKLTTKYEDSPSEDRPKKYKKPNPYHYLKKQKTHTRSTLLNQFYLLVASIKTHYQYLEFREIVPFPDVFFFNSICDKLPDCNTRLTPKLLHPLRPTDSPKVRPTDSPKVRIRVHSFLFTL